LLILGNRYLRDYYYRNRNINKGLVNSKLVNIKGEDRDDVNLDNIITRRIESKLSKVDDLEVKIKTKVIDIKELLNNTLDKVEINKELNINIIELGVVRLPEDKVGKEDNNPVKEELKDVVTNEEEELLIATTFGLEFEELVDVVL
jgi:hypothetical protein